jgi:hypothetical protein
VEKNRRPRYEYKTMPTFFLTKALKICDGEKKASSTNIVGKN